MANAAHSGGAQIISVAHHLTSSSIQRRQIHLRTTKQFTTGRVRLKQINPLGTITVESIHLDFSVSTDTGAWRLHSRTAFNTGNNFANDSMMVLVRSDLLIDETGKPYQRLGTSSQAMTERSDGYNESPNEFHGFIYSRSCCW